jgi:hypothetical protein
LISGERCQRLGSPPQCGGDGAFTTDRTCSCEGTTVDFRVSISRDGERMRR